jgi:hypothetical protein
MKAGWLIAVCLLAGSAGFFLRARTHRPALPPAPKFATAECRAGYDRLYGGPALEFRIVFGYKDARPARFVADRYERMMLVERLVADCKGTDTVCGFHRDEKETDLFTKQMTGPDGKPRAVHLRVASASAGADDVENRTDPFQENQSRFAEALYLEGLEHADVVLYNGHSRDGGGPDFRPPRLRDGHVDYGWYRSEMSGIGLTLDRLRIARGPPPLELLGILSCASTKHFLDKIHAVRPGLALLTSPKLLYFSDAFESTVASLGSVLRMRCEPEFLAALKLKETRMGDIRISDWF